MKYIRIIALLLCFLMIAPLVVACNNNGDVDNNTTTTTTTTTKPSKPRPTKPLTVAELYFEEEGEEVADGFVVTTEGDIAVKDSAIKVENSTGAYLIEDTDLVLNYDNYQTLSITAEVKFDKFHASSDGQVSIISPLFCLEENISESNPLGMVYQFFLKVDSNGILYYYSSRAKWSKPIEMGGGPITIKEGATNIFTIDYNIEFGSYTISMNGIELVSDSLITTMDVDMTSKFFIRLFDHNEANGKYTASIGEVTIVATP